MHGVRHQSRALNAWHLFCGHLRVGSEVERPHGDFKLAAVVTRATCYLALSEFLSCRDFHLMNNTRFVSLLCCGVVAAGILAGPSWLKYWSDRTNDGPTLGQLSYTTEETGYWNPAGYESNKKDHEGEVKVTARLFKSRVIRESGTGPKEQMVFAQVVVENKSPAPVYIYELKVHGFDKGIQIFSIPVMKSADISVSLTPPVVPCEFNSEGVFIPAYLIHDKISASVTLTSKPLNVTF